jgi:hypothetical protein
MAVQNFTELVSHAGHNVAVVTYGLDVPINVAVECEDCYEVLFDFEREGENNDQD